MILERLPPLAVLALKFVSKSAYLRTKYANGQDIVDVKAREGARSFRNFMTALEAFGLQNKNLRRLTCQSCGNLKANNRYGFHDLQFQQHDEQRWCIQCTHEYYLLPETFTVRGEKMFFCGFNRCVRPVEQQARPSDMLLMAHSVQIFLMDPSNRSQFTAGEVCCLLDKKSMCIQCLRDCMIRTQAWSNANVGGRTESLKAFTSHQEMLEKSLSCRAGYDASTAAR